MTRRDHLRRALAAVRGLEQAARCLADPSSREFMRVYPNAAVLVSMENQVAFYHDMLDEAAHALVRSGSRGVL